MSKETKNTETEKKETKSCCPSGAMQDFFQQMAPFCSGLSDTDCEAMMKSMKEKFCHQDPAGNKTCGN